MPFTKGQIPASSPVLREKEEVIGGQGGSERLRGLIASKRGKEALIFYLIKGEDSSLRRGEV